MEAFESTDIMYCELAFDMLRQNESRVYQKIMSGIPLNHDFILPVFIPESEVHLAKFTNVQSFKTTIRNYAANRLKGAQDWAPRRSDFIVYSIGALTSKDFSYDLDISKMLNHALLFYAITHGDAKCLEFLDEIFEEIDQNIPADIFKDLSKLYKNFHFSHNTLDSDRIVNRYEIFNELKKRHFKQVLREVTEENDNNDAPKRRI